MCHNRFTIQIDLFKYKRFKDGEFSYKNTGSSHLKVRTKNWGEWQKFHFRLWKNHLYRQLPLGISFSNNTDFRPYIIHNCRIQERADSIWRTNQIKSNEITGLLSLLQSEDWIVGYLTSCDIYTNRLHLLTRLIFKVFRYSFSEAIPIFFNRFKSDFILVWSL